MRKDCPVTFLPVRLETIFVGQDVPKRLKIRVFPDEIHIDEHDPRLSPDEVAIGNAFWAKLKAAGADETSMASVMDWFATALGDRRAAYVAGATAPGQTPKMHRNAGDRPAVARCLPKFWRAIGYRRLGNGTLEPAFQHDGAPIPQSLCMDLVFGQTENVDAPAATNATWLKNFNKAKEFGMALDVPVGSYPWLRQEGLAALLVYGVGAPGSAWEANRLETLLTAHRFTSGAAFQAQGVPTNSTDAAKTDVSGNPAARDGTLEAVVVSEATEMDGETNGHRMARAIGLGDASVVASLDGAERDEIAGQAAMNEALWPVTFGAYFNRMLADNNGRGKVPKSAVSYIRKAFLDEVRAAGPLPALRIGSQPYGVLPIRAHSVPQQWSSPEPWYEFLLVKFRDVWLTATPNVAKLSAEGDRPRTETLDAVVRVLAGQPHPSRFLLRGLRDWRTESHDSGWMDLLALLGLVFLAGDDPTFGHDSRSILGQWGWGKSLLGNGVSDETGAGISANKINSLDASDLGSNADQLAALRSMRRQLRFLVPDAEKREGARAWIDYMIRQVEAHGSRLEPLLSEFGPLPLSGISGVLRNAASDPKIAYHLYDKSARELTRNLVTGPAEDAADGEGRLARPQIYLRAAAGRVPADTVLSRLDTTPSRRVDRAGSRALDGLKTSRFRAENKFDGPLSSVVQPAQRPKTRGTGGISEPSISGNLGRSGTQPLLQQLVDAAVAEVPDGQRRSYKDALEALAELPVATLEWHLRETLGLASSRLDAWLTSLATRRLAEMGDAKRVQIGGYGIVLDLKPDLGTPEERGYIHAPSMAQAATAGILHSAWLNHGTDDEASPLSVNLSSDRLRTADRLIQAVSQGRMLGDILGQHIERALHDAGLDVHIDALRRATLKAMKEPGPPKGPLDGLNLIEAVEKGLVTSEINAIKPKAARETILAAIDSAKASFDALGDAGLAEAVHYLTQGNAARAAAILDAVSLGESPPSELRHARTRISRSELVHRVIVALAPRASGENGRAQSHPALANYVEAFLPKWQDLRVQVVSGSTVHDIALGDLGFGSLDLVQTIARPGGLALRASAHLAADGASISADAILERPVGTQADLFEDLEQVVNVVALHIGALRTANSEDLGMDQPQSLPESGALRDRITALYSALKATYQKLRNARTRGQHRAALKALLELDLCGHPGALPGPELLADPNSEAFGGFVDQVLKAVEKRLTIAGRAQRTDATLEQLTDALKALGAQGLEPEMPTKGVPLAFGADFGFAAPPQSVLMDWAGLYGHVRKDIRRWINARDDASLVTGKQGYSLALAQHTPTKEKAWLGIALPSGEATGGQSWVAVDAGGVSKLRRGQEAVVYLVDSWTERLPEKTATTGIAAGFDAPASKPPQAILLAVTPDKETGWSDALIRRTLLETIENAQLRAVTNAELDRFGHHLPAIFVPDGIDAGPQPPEPEDESQ